MLNNSILVQLKKKLMEVVGIQDDLFNESKSESGSVVDALYGEDEASDHSFESVEHIRGVEKGIYTNAQKSIHGLIKELDDITTYTDPNPKRKDVLTPETALMLMQKYMLFEQHCREYLASDNAEIAYGPISAALVPVRSYINMFKKIAEGELKDVTLEQVLCNDRQLDGLFNSDLVPKAAEDEELPEITEPEGIVKDYREVKEKIAAKTDTHVAIISGSASRIHRYDVLEAKLALIEDVLWDNNQDQNEINSLLETPHPLIGIAKDWKEWDERVGRPDVKDRSDIVTTEVFSQKKGDAKKQREYVKKMKLSRDAEVSIVVELDKVTFAAEKAGITDAEVKKLNVRARQFSIPFAKLDEIINEKKLYDFKKITDKNDPANGIYSAVEAIWKKTQDALNQVEDRKELTDEDFKAVSDQVQAYIKNGSVNILEKNGSDFSPNKFMFSMIDLCDQLGHVYPPMKKETEKCLKALKDKVKPEYDAAMEIINNTQKTEPKFKSKLKNALKHVRALRDSGCITAEQEEKAEMICMARDADLCTLCMTDLRYDLNRLTRYKEKEIPKQQKQKADNIVQIFNDNRHIYNYIDVPQQIPVPKLKLNDNRTTGITVLVDEEIRRLERLMIAGRIIEIERSNLYDTMSTRHDYKERCEKMPAYCMVFAASQYTNRPFEAKDGNSVTNYLNDYLKTEPVKEKIGAGADKYNEFTLEKNVSDIAQGALDQGFKPLEYLELSDEEFDALTQESGNFDSENSKEYNDIREQIWLLNQGRNAGNREAKPFKKLYNACSTYLQAHDSWAWTDNGRLRYDAAAMIIRRLMIPLSVALRTDTRSKDALEREMKLNMIRNEKFRHNLMADAQNRLDKFERNGGELNEDQQVQLELCNKILAAGRKLDEALKDYRHHAETGKMETGDKVNALLAKYERCFREDQREIQAGPQVPQA